MFQKSDSGYDAFSSYHPLILFLYFCVVLFFNMFFMHPAILIISLISMFIYSVMLNGLRALKFNVLYMLPVTVIVALINPLFNHYGVTILFYLNNNPITLESVVYGIILAVVFISVIIGFSCFNKVMTSDKLIYLFGRLIPILSLMFSMTLRFVPRYKAQLKKISNAQKCIGMDASRGNVLKRIKNGVRIISILITWALENAIESADSMKARGFGLRGRTSFSLFSWKKRDKAFFVLQIVLLGIILTGMGWGKFNSQYSPMITISGMGEKSFLFFLAYAVFCLLPVMTDVKESIVWSKLKSVD
jgi:ABC-type cobalt transport system, permease component CbiQ and related transporters